MIKQWLYKKFDDWAIRHNRKYALVNTLGEIFVYRYYVFYLEDHFDTSWKAKYLPNLMIHHYVVDNSLNGSEILKDIEEPHFHPWNTLSIILKGGFREEYNLGESYKDYTAPAITARSWKTSHLITNVKKDTWSLFFHGIRKSNWALHVKPHKEICDFCTKHNNGICANVNNPERKEFVKGLGIPSCNNEVNHWKYTVWIKYDDSINDLIAKRKSSFEKLKQIKQRTDEEWNSMAKNYLTKLRVQNKL